MEKVDLIQLELAVKQLIEMKTEPETETDNFILVNNEDEEHRRLLTGLLNQLEILKADEQDQVEVKQPEVLGQKEEEEEEEAPSSAVTVNSNDIVEQKDDTSVEVESINTGFRKEDDNILKELGRVKRQNFISHCLLSAMILLTVAWQVSEVSLIFKLKHGITHPFRSFGNFITGILKNPNQNTHDQGGNNRFSGKQPAFNISELCHVDLPALDFDADEE